MNENTCCLCDRQVEPEALVVFDGQIMCLDCLNQHTIIGFGSIRMQARENVRFVSIVQTAIMSTAVSVEHRYPKAMLTMNRMMGKTLTVKAAFSSCRGESPSGTITLNRYPSFMEPETGISV